MAQLDVKVVRSQCVFQSSNASKLLRCFGSSFQRNKGFGVERSKVSIYIYIYYIYNHVYLFILDVVLSLFLTFSQPSMYQIVLFVSPKEIQGEALWWHDGDDSHILPFLLGNDPICCVQRKWQVVTCFGSHFSAHLLVFWEI